MFVIQSSDIFHNRLSKNVCLNKLGDKEIIIGCSDNVVILQPSPGGLNSIP